MANIYRRGKIWWGRIQKRNVPLRKSLRTTNKELARKRLREWLDELDAIAWGDRPRRRFDAMAERFVTEHLPTLKPSSAKRYGVSLIWLCEEFEGEWIDKLTSARLSDFERKRRGMGVAVPTIRRDFACLSSMFGCAIEWEWCDGNPVPVYMRRRRKRGLRESPPRTRYLNHEEEARLLACAGPEVVQAIAFAIDTGLRREEQFGLRRSEVDWTRNRVRVLRSGAKSDKPRDVPLLPRSSQILAQMPAFMHGHVFGNLRTGERLLTMNKGLAGAARRAGIKDLRWHDLRRTCGCRLLQDHGLSMEQVREWLGHHSVTVTERHYAFLSIDSLQNAVTKTVTGIAD